VATLQATQPSRFCRQCGYALTGLSENRCPECGRAFEPGDPRTYLHQPRSWAVRRWTRRIALTLAAAGLGAVVVLASLWGNVYWEYHADWQAEQNAIAALKRAGVDIWPNDPGYRPYGTGSRTIRLPCDPWVARLTRPLDHLRDRVAYVGLDREGKELTRADFANLAIFKHLQQVDLGSVLITDGQMADLAACLKDRTQLRQLFVRSHLGEMTDAGLAHLGRLTQLTRLSVWGPRITGEGLAQLQTLTGLKRLDLTRTRISDDYLDRFKAFPSMTYLGLAGAPVTDAGLEHLTGLKTLRDLDLRDTRVTRQGVASFQKALPGARILWSEDRQGGSSSND
jgi:hypothetical protein